MPGVWTGGQGERERNGWRERFDVSSLLVGGAQRGIGGHTRGGARRDAGRGSRERGREGAREGASERGRERKGGRGSGCARERTRERERVRARAREREIITSDYSQRGDWDSMRLWFVCVCDVVWEVCAMCVCVRERVWER